MTDLDYLQLALEEAIAAGQSGEVPVGAIIVTGGQVLVRAQNRVLRDNDPTAHAEVVALRAAGQALGNHRLNGCTLFVTLEPCSCVPEPSSMPASTESSTPPPTPKPAPQAQSSPSSTTPASTTRCSSTPAS